MPCKVSLDFIWLNEQFHGLRGASNWMSGVAYKFGDIVTTGPSTNYTYWICTQRTISSVNGDHDRVRPRGRCSAATCGPTIASTTYNFRRPGHRRATSSTSTRARWPGAAPTARPRTRTTGARHPPDAHHQPGPDRDGADGPGHHRDPQSEDDAVYLCTTDSQASNLRNAAYIRANAWNLAESSSI